MNSLNPKAKKRNIAELAPNLAPYRRSIVKLLSHFIRIPSVKGEAQKKAPYGRIPAETLRVFLAHAGQKGFRVKEYPGRVGYLEFGPEDGPLIAAVCHLDVVPAGNWSEAFSPVITETEIIGRGAADDKGPTVAVYYAMRSLLYDNYEPKCRIRLILGLDEESGSGCMKYYREHDEIPVAAFTADADFPVIAAEKGICRFSLRYNEPQAPTTPDNCTFTVLNGGTKENIVAERCRYDLRSPENKRLATTVDGKAAHASTPEEGENAIALAFAELGAKQVSSEMVQWYNRYIGLETNGNSLGIAVSDEDSGALTLNTGLATFDGKEWELRFDLRYPVTSDAQSIIEKIRTLAASANITLEFDEDADHTPALHLPHDHPLVSTLTDVYNQATGENLSPIGIGGGTYARALPNTVAFGAVFPGEEVNMHQDNERVSIDSLVLAAEIYRSAFIKLDEIYGK